MKTIHLFMAVLLIITIIEIIAFKTYLLITDEDYYGWPAVTKCNICNKTVWDWQKYERREYKVKNNGNYHVMVSASGLVHKNCKGNPVVEYNISVK